MDIIRAIQELYQEKKRLDAAIAYLESLPAKRPAGRRAAPQAARKRKRHSALQVSEDMLRYWNK